MKKIFLALSVLAVLGFSLAPVYANVPGARDISPGSEFVSYFLVSKARVTSGSGPSTLLSISETKGKVDVKTTAGIIYWSKLHFVFYTVDSVKVHDLNITITRWATLLKDIGAMVEGMSTDTKAKLAVTFDDADYYAGYVTVTETHFKSADNIIADVIQLDLTTGLASIANIPVKANVEDIEEARIRTVLKTNEPETVTTRTKEVWTGNAMAAATGLVWEGTVVDATWFAMYPKYLINDSTGKTYWIIWRSSVVNTLTGGKIATITFNTWVINGAEDYRSTSIKIRELSILDAGDIIPGALQVSYPYIGQVNLRIPGEDGATPSDTYLTMEMLGWSWRTANDGATGAATNWAGMSLMAADAGTGDLFNPTH